MSFEENQVTKAAKAAAKKILRRNPGDPDPIKVIECFSGDLIEIPFLGLCEFAFFIGRRKRVGKVDRIIAGRASHAPVYSGGCLGFVRLYPMDRNPPRSVLSIPAWVPVRCVRRYQ